MLEEVFQAWRQPHSKLEVSVRCLSCAANNSREHLVAKKYIKSLGQKVYLQVFNLFRFIKELICWFFNLVNKNTGNRISSFVFFFFGKIFNNVIAVNIVFVSENFLSSFRNFRDFIKYRIKLEILIVD